MSDKTEAVLDVIEDQIDALEDQIDGIVDVVEVVRSNPKVVVAVGIVGVIAGGAVGYFVAKKRLEKVYEQRMSDEIAEARSFYANMYKVGEDGEPLTPLDVMTMRHGKEAAEALRSYQGQGDDEWDGTGDPVLEGEPHDEVVDEAQIKKIEESIKVTSTVEGDVAKIEEESKSINVFIDPTFDLEEEMKYRTEEAPYIITHDEFYEGEKNYDTVSLTYFMVDNTVTDERDQPLEHVDKVIGEDHLVRFGSGSKDKNTVYIRNDRLETDYEIVRSKGSYLEEVLGMAEEPETRERRQAPGHGDG